MAQGQALRERHGGEPHHHLPRRDAGGRAHPDETARDFRVSGGRARGAGRRPPRGCSASSPTRHALRRPSRPAGQRADDQGRHHREGRRPPGRGRAACCTTTGWRSCWSSTRTAAASGCSPSRTSRKRRSTPPPARTARGRLRVAAASTVGDKGYERALALIDAGGRLRVWWIPRTPFADGARPGRAHQRVSNKVAIIAGQRGDGGGHQGADRLPGPTPSRSASGRARSAPRGWSPASACRSSPPSWIRRRPPATSRSSPMAASCSRATWRRRWPAARNA